MVNVFKKLIRTEFGEKKYSQYVNSLHIKMMEKNYDYHNLQNEEIFNDIYDNLKDKDIEFLKVRFEHLTDAMLQVVRISKTYFTIFLVCIISMIFLLTIDLQPLITVGSIVLIIGCLIYKTYEYIANKFCYIDARIIIVYKSVLDSLIIKKYKSSLL